MAVQSEVDRPTPGDLENPEWKNGIPRPQGMSVELLNALSDEIIAWEDSDELAYVLAIKVFELIKANRG